MIYLIVAPPRSGKTYFATTIALADLVPKKTLLGRKKPTHSVYTNYPVCDQKTGLSTYRWISKYTKENIQDSTIIIDEAWLDYSSRKYKDFTAEIQGFFAMNGHNGNDIYIIAQNAARVDLIIREMVNELYYVRKIAIPFIDRPLFFIVYVYHDLNEMARMTPDPYASVKKKFVLFKKRVARAYDTHYFRKQTPPIQPQTWSEYQSQTSQYDPETDTSV